jgi:hypothetical protein
MARVRYMFINDYIHNTVYFDILITGISANALYCRGEEMGIPHSKEVYV